MIDEKGRSLRHLAFGAGRGRLLVPVALTDAGPEDVLELYFLGVGAYVVDVMAGGAVLLTAGDFYGSALDHVVLIDGVRDDGCAGDLRNGAAGADLQLSVSGNDLGVGALDEGYALHVEDARVDVKSSVRCRKVQVVLVWVGAREAVLAGLGLEGNVATGHVPVEAVDTRLEFVVGQRRGQIGGVVLEGGHLTFKVYVRLYVGRLQGKAIVSGERLDGYVRGVGVRAVGAEVEVLTAHIRRVPAQFAVGLQRFGRQYKAADEVVGAGFEHFKGRFGLGVHDKGIAVGFEFDAHFLAGHLGNFPAGGTGFLQFETFRGRRCPVQLKTKVFAVDVCLEVGKFPLAAEAAVAQAYFALVAAAVAVSILPALIRLGDEAEAAVLLDGQRLFHIREDAAAEQFPVKFHLGRNQAIHTVEAEGC